MRLLNKIKNAANLSKDKSKQVPLTQRLNWEYREIPNLLELSRQKDEEELTELYGFTKNSGTRDSETPATDMFTLTSAFNADEAILLNRWTDGERNVKKSEILKLTEFYSSLQTGELKELHERLLKKLSGMSESEWDDQAASMPFWTPYSEADITEGQEDVIVWRPVINAEENKKQEETPV